MNNRQWPEPDPGWHKYLEREFRRCYMLNLHKFLQTENQKQGEVPHESVVKKRRIT